MPNIAGDNATDIPSLVGPCEFNAKPIPEDSYTTVENVKLDGQKAKFIDVKKHVPDQIPGIPLIPLVVCPTLPRTIANVKNTSVYIGGSLVTVIGDEAAIPGSTPRTIIGPIKHPKIFIASLI